jgi:MFS family permease
MKVILPLLAFSTWRNGDIRRNEITVNIAILTGSIIGQTVCGYLADRYGRLKLYGYHFIALSYATICFAQSSSGFNSMSVMALLVIWGFFAGVSNGAGQPLAATITAEYVRYFIDTPKAVPSTSPPPIIELCIAQY